MTHGQGWPVHEASSWHDVALDNSRCWGNSRIQGSLWVFTPNCFPPACHGQSCTDVFPLEASRSSASISYSFLAQISCFFSLSWDFLFYYYMCFPFNLNRTPPPPWGRSRVKGERVFYKPTEYRIQKQGKRGNTWWWFFSVHMSVVCIWACICSGRIVQLRQPCTQLLTPEQGSCVTYMITNQNQ